MSKRYEVQSFTVFDGWSACWQINGEPWIFESEAEAEAEIREHIADCEDAVAKGDMPDAPTREDFRIVEVEA
jgi:hypothetical protein